MARSTDDRQNANSGSYKEPEPHDGTELDRTRDIALRYGINYPSYFNTKARSISRYWIRQAAQSENPADQHWMRESFLQELQNQMEDVHNAVELSTGHDVEDSHVVILPTGASGPTANV